jgi:hypothetical protein
MTAAARPGTARPGPAARARYGARPVQRARYGARLVRLWRLFVTGTAIRWRRYVLPALNNVRFRRFVRVSHTPVYV